MSPNNPPEDSQSSGGLFFFISNFNKVHSPTKKSVENPLSQGCQVFFYFFFGFQRDWTGSVVVWSVGRYHSLPSVEKTTPYIGGNRKRDR